MRPRPICLPDGELGVFVPESEAGWLYLLLKDYLPRYMATSGLRPRLGFSELGFALIAVLRGELEDELLDLSNLSPRRQVLDRADVDEPSWLSTGEAARRLGVTRRTAQRLARGGHLRGALRVGKGWMIPASSVLGAQGGRREEGGSEGESHEGGSGEFGSDR